MLRIYITCLESMLQKLTPTPSVESQLDTLYENLLPELKRVRGEGCHTVDDLIDRAVKGEITLDDRYSPIAGYVDLPFEVASVTRDVNLAIMLELDADCYLGVNFVRAFMAAFDPCSNTLLIKDARTKVSLAPCTDASSTALAAIGLARVTASQRENLQQVLDSLPADEPGTTGCTAWVEHVDSFYPRFDLIKDCLLLSIGIFFPFE